MYIPFWELARKPDKRYYLWLGQGTGTLDSMDLFQNA